MKIGNIDWGNVFAGAGTLNFSGQGWPHHKYYKLIPGFNFSGATMITKTVTLEPRVKSNLILDPETLMPVEKFPDCIKARFISGEVYNAVGLTGPGARALFESGKWQKITAPFIVSFAPTRESKIKRIDETKKFINVFMEYIKDFSASVGLELNISCPNSRNINNIDETEISEHLKISSELGITQGLKIGVASSINSAKIIADSGNCDFIDIPNSLPFYHFRSRIDWNERFEFFYPLFEKYMSGGYSGRQNFHLAKDWVREARREGLGTKIILGGIVSRKNVRQAKEAGADAVSFARASIVRPWRIKGIIQEANRIFEE